MEEKILKKDMFERPQGGLFDQVLESEAVMFMAKQNGIDFVFFDCEHGAHSYDRLHDLMLCGNAIGMPSIVRVPELSRAWISRALDFGAQGIMVPMTETRQQAERIVQYSKYPPLGQRSYSGGAHTFYGPSGHHSENMAKANAKVISIAQIETVKGVENIEDILSVEGIDAAIIGPVDLSISMGHPDDVYTEEEISAIEKVCSTCEKYHKGFGIIGSEKMLELFRGRVNLMVDLIDAHMLRDSFAKASEAYRKLY